MKLHAVLVFNEHIIFIYTTVETKHFIKFVLEHVLQNQ